MGHWGSSWPHSPVPTGCGPKRAGAAWSAGEGVSTSRAAGRACITQTLLPARSGLVLSRGGCGPGRARCLPGTDPAFPAFAWGSWPWGAAASCSCGPRSASFPLPGSPSHTPCCHLRLLGRASLGCAGAPSPLGPRPAGGVGAGRCSLSSLPSSRGMVKRGGKTHRHNVQRLSGSKLLPFHTDGSVSSRDRWLAHSNYRNERLVSLE